ncbi:unnamed protein product [Meloidogyne enterolobii]|uniref:Uncharacterized protein n=1 Tax=Meloidogyne enterolobii TaxID=390850 RepID=A0ACB1B281_MELEN
MSSSTFCFLIVAALIAQIVVSAPVADKTVQKRHAVYAPAYSYPYYYAPAAPASSSFVSGGGGSGGGIQSVIGGGYGLPGSSFVAGGGGYGGGGIQSVIGGR